VLQTGTKTEDCEVWRKTQENTELYRDFIAFVCFGGIFGGDSINVKYH